VTIAAGPVVIPRTGQSVEEAAMPAESTVAENAATSVTMIEPLAGFETDTEYTLTRIDDAGMLQSLRSVRDTDLRFVISPAEVFFAAYRDSLTDVIAAPVAGALGVAQSEADLALYVMLTIGTSLKDTTANLRAPLVVDRATGRAVQVILEDDTLPLSQPLPTE
jgi:flagellar assembly factor FliW